MILPVMSIFLQIALRKKGDWNAEVNDLNVSILGYTWGFLFPTISTLIYLVLGSDWWILSWLDGAVSWLTEHWVSNLSPVMELITIINIFVLIGDGEDSESYWYLLLIYSLQASLWQLM